MWTSERAWGEVSRDGARVGREGVGVAASGASLNTDRIPPASDRCVPRFTDSLLDRSGLEAPRLRTLGTVRDGWANPLCGPYRVCVSSQLQRISASARRGAPIRSTCTCTCTCTCTIRAYTACRADFLRNSEFFPRAISKADAFLRLFLPALSARPVPRLVEKPSLSILTQARATDDELWCVYDPEPIPILVAMRTSGLDFVLGGATKPMWFNALLLRSPPT
jgi:hypothetical protein